MNLPKKNWLEWTVFGASVLLVAGVLAYLAYSSATQGDAPPDLVVQLGEPVQQSQHYSIPVAVSNQGDNPAEDVVVRITLDTGGEPEESEFSVSYLPGGGEGNGWATFTSDPRSGALSTRIVGYTSP
jgi:uncharacterized protein (TIGR02588 family)